MLAQDAPRPMAGSRRVTHQQRKIAESMTSGPVQVEDIDQPLVHVQPSPDMTTAGSGPHPPPQQQQQQSQSQQQQQQQYFSLPVYSDELGRIPLHSQIEFSSPAQQQQQSMSHHQPYWYNGSQQPGGPAAGPTRVNVNVNVNVSSGPAQSISMPLSAGGRPIGQEQQQGIPSTSPTGYAGIPDAGSAGPPQMYSQHQLGVLGYAGGYHHATSGSSGAGVSSRRQEGHYAMGRGHPPPQYQYPPPQQPPQQQPQPGSQQNFVDSDTMTMWSNAPTGFECVLLAPLPLLVY